MTVDDYYSRYPEIAHLKNTNSVAVINKLKSVFVRHGVPKVLISDNGLQYGSAEFAEFARNYGFTHATSSPKYARANRAAERSVQTLKGILWKGNVQGFIDILRHTSRDWVQPSRARLVNASAIQSRHSPSLYCPSFLIWVAYTRRPPTVTAPR